MKRFVPRDVFHSLFRLPDMPPIGLRECARAGAGALLGILATGLIARAAIGAGSALPALIAPMGASAVLLFAVPASPLAQPWSILGGNVVAAIVGVTAATLVPDHVAAGALAVGLAIALMASLRCLHPPGGAVALTAVLGGPAVTDLGYGFVLWPVAANSALLLGVALAFNTLTGRRYPHVPQAVSGAPAARADEDRLTAADLDAALEGFDGVLEVERGDLQAILRRAQIHASLRRSGRTTCAAVMTRPMRAVAPEMPLRQALALLRSQSAAFLPVTDEGARLLGIVTRADLVDNTVWDGGEPRLALGRRVRLTLVRGRAPHGSVGDVMRAGLDLPAPETSVGAAMQAMTRAGLEQAPVVGADGRMVGMVSSADLLPALLADFASAGDSAVREGSASAPRDAVRSREGGLASSR